MFTEITRIEIWHGTDAGDEEILATVEGGGLVACSDDESGYEAGANIDALRTGLDCLFSSIYGPCCVRFPELGE